jgi:PPE-repeat protein
MDFAIIPPEINSGRMYAGPGAGPMLAGAAAWDGLAAELRSAAASYASVISGLTAGPWLGPASASMAAAAGPYMAWIGTTAAQTEQAATQAKAAAAAYEVAFAATVPPWVIAANRSLLMALVATNIFGQNTPAIAATEAQYAEMWAQDAATMYGYAGQSAAASTLTPFTPAPNTTNPAGLAGQAAALAETSGTSAGTGVQTVVSTGPQLLSAVPTALQGLAQPLQSTSGLSGILDSLGFTSPQSFLSLGNLVNPYTGAAASVNLGTGTPRLNIRQERTMHTAPHRPDQSTADQGPRAGEEGAEDEDDVSSGTGVLAPAGPAGLGASAATASLGQGSVVGGLSVPPGWVMAAPEIRTVAALLPMTSATAAPAVSTGMSGTLFSEMALASMVGRAIGSTVSPGARERMGVTARAYSAPPPRSPGGPMTGISAEICELAELLGKLGGLRDSGILTDEEFNEQKHRLLAR